MSINGAAIAQAVVIAIVLFVINAVLRFVSSRLNITTKAENDMVEVRKEVSLLSARIDRQEQRGAERRREQKVIMMALVTLLDCFKGKKPNGELDDAQHELKSVIYELDRSVADDS